MYQGQDGNVGAGLPNNQFFPSPQSDIVLSTQKNKKSKIWIVAIVAILVLVTIVMVVLFMPKKGTTGGGVYAKEKCANLIAYGEEGKNNDTDDDDYFEQAYYYDEIEKWDSYYKKVIQCLDSGLESDNTDELEKKDIEGMRELARVLDYDKRLNDRYEYLFNLYLKNGRYGAKRMLEDDLSGFSREKGGAAIPYYSEKLRGMLDVVGNLIDLNEAFGCAGDSYQNYECPEIDLNSEKVEQLGFDRAELLDYRSIENDIDEIVENMVDYFMNDSKKAFADGGVNE